MRTHTNYGVNFEKDPPFKLTVQAVDQDDLQLFSHVIINIGDDEYVDDGYQVVFSSAIEYDLSEITISVDAVNQHQNVTPNSRNVKLVFQVPKAPPPKPSPPPEPSPPPRPVPPQGPPKREKKQPRPQPPPPPREEYMEETPPPAPSPPPPSPRPRKKIEVTELQLEKVVGTRRIESNKNDDLNNDLKNLVEDNVLQIQRGEELKHALESFTAERQYEIQKTAYTDMERSDVGKVLREVRSIARVLNVQLQKKIKGRKTFSISDERKGPLSIKHTLPSIARQAPALKYINTLDREPPRYCNVFVDVSKSTNLTVAGPDNHQIKIKHSLMLAALSIAEVIVELGGEVRIVLFSDSDNKYHGEILTYKNGTQAQVIEHLLDLQPIGGTRLDEVLSKIPELNRPRKADSTFIFLDGAPMVGYFQVDVDDQVQQDTIALLKGYEKDNQIFIFWASSPNNRSDYDAFFFERCQKELEKVAVVNLQSFPAFTTYAHLIWHMPPQKDKIPSVYNTTETYPFELDDTIKSRVKELLVPGNQEKTAENVRAWVLKNFRYSYPVNRKYRTAMEVAENGYGCCGEMSNLIIGIFRHFGIPSGIIEVDYIQQVRINHACVGFFIEGEPKLIDVTFGEINTKDGIGNPVSDARWARLMDYWRGNPRVIKNRQ